MLERRPRQPWGARPQRCLPRSRPPRTSPASRGGSPRRAALRDRDAGSPPAEEPCPCGSRRSSCPRPRRAQHAAARPRSRSPEPRRRGGLSSPRARLCWWKLAWGGHDSVAGMPARERFLAWIYTGPLGHLYGTVADVTQLWFLYLASLIRRRLTGSGGLGS